MALVGSGNKRKRTNENTSEEIVDDPGEPGGSRIKQMRMDDYKSGTFCSQSKFNILLTKWIVNDYQAFSVVESPLFRELITAAGSGPTKTVIGRKTLMTSVEEQVRKQSQELAGIIANIEFVATTADSWKSFNRYIITHFKNVVFLLHQNQLPMFDNNE